MTADAISVKFIARGPEDFWLHQFPGGQPAWGGCVFVFDREAREYDWLVVYDDVPGRASGAGGRHASHSPVTRAIPCW